MKPVYKCDYCSFMGTEEEVKEHEPNCNENYDMRSCYTCKNRGRAIFKKEDNINRVKYECDAGNDVPHNKYTGCPKLNDLVTPPDFYCAFGMPKITEDIL